jgi:hypothetical protein
MQAQLEQQPGVPPMPSTTSTESRLSSGRRSTLGDTHSRSAKWSNQTKGERAQAEIVSSTERIGTSPSQSI